jgi:ribosomal protein S18 acetylase RimI-like enzyme
LKIVSLGQASPPQYFHEVARLHETELQAGLLAKLGTEFLEDFYRHVAGDRECVLLAAIEGEHAVGFLSGTCDIRKFYRRYVMRRGLKLAVHLLPHLLSIGSLSPIASFRRYLGSRGGGDLPRDIPASELTSLAVGPSARHRGVGKTLFSAFREHLRSRGIGTFKVSAATTQKAALLFYPAQGAKIVANTHLGELELIVFVCTTGAPAASTS